MLITPLLGGGDFFKFVHVLIRTISGFLGLYKMGLLAPLQKSRTPLAGLVYLKIGRWVNKV